MINRPIVSLHQSGVRLAEKCRVGFFFSLSFSDPLDHGAALAHLLRRTMRAPRMKSHDVTRYLAKATPGISVIGNISHALSCQVRAANRQDAIPYNFPDPRNQTMSNDVI